MKIIYIKENEETCDIIKRTIAKIKKLFSIVNSKYYNDNIVYYLPLFKSSKVTKFRIKRISKKIIKLLEKDESNTIVLSEYLNNMQLLKNCLYSENINILNGRYLFKCLTYNIIEHIFKIRNKELEFRRSFNFN